MTYGECNVRDRAEGPLPRAENLFGSRQFRRGLRLVALFNDEALFNDDPQYPPDYAKADDFINSFIDHHHATIVETLEGGYLLTMALDYLPNSQHFIDRGHDELIKKHLGFYSGSSSSDIAKRKNASDSETQADNLAHDDKRAMIRVNKAGLNKVMSLGGNLDEFTIALGFLPGIEIQEQERPAQSRELIVPIPAPTDDQTTNEQIEESTAELLTGRVETELLQSMRASLVALLEGLTEQTENNTLLIIAIRAYKVACDKPPVNPGDLGAAVCQAT
jgi:hypothetical protein